MSDNQQIPGFEEQPRPPQTPEPPASAPDFGQPLQQPGVQPPPPPSPGYGQAPGEPPMQTPYGEAPPPPQYGQPPYGQMPPQPQYGQSPGQPPYGQAPGQPPYGQAPAPYVPQPAESTLKLNWWLSAFFGIIPAAIFYFMDKGKDPLYDDHLKENMNFSLLRLFVSVASSLVYNFVPRMGGMLSSVINLGSLVLFVLAIMAAIKAPALFKSGQPYRFPIRIELMK